MRHRSLVPWLIALTCLGPFALALALYFGPWGRDWLPDLPGSRELLEPPIALSAAWLDDATQIDGARYRWLLIYARMTPCGEQCVDELGRLRQVQLALGPDLDRVQRVYLHTGDSPRIPDDQPLLMRRLEGAEGEALVRSLGLERIRDARVYVADPQRRVIVSYPAQVAQRELLRDLKRLLAGSGTD